MPRAMRRTRKETRGTTKRARRSGRKASRPAKPSRKAIVREYFRLVGEGKFTDGLRFFADDCVTHNPYIAGNMKAIADGQAAAARQTPPFAMPDPAFAVEHLLEDGDLVAAHTHLLGSRTNPGAGGLRQVHLFRFRGDTIIEYWDITQMVGPDEPNAAGAL